MLGVWVAWGGTDESFMCMEYASLLKQAKTAAVYVKTVLRAILICVWGLSGPQKL